MIDASTVARLAAWLDETIGGHQFREWIASDHPVRAWSDRFSSEPGNVQRLDHETLRTLVDVLANGGHLPLLAGLLSMARAQARAQLPPDIERALGAALCAYDEGLRRNLSPPRSVPDVFLCYAHQDADRVEPLVRVLRRKDLSLFHDVEDIAPGASIAATVASAIEAARAAVVVVSAASEASFWVQREIAGFLLGSATRGLLICPVVIDDIPVPARIRDLFAVDLRGLDPATPEDVIERRLTPLIDRLQSELNR